MNKAVLLKIVNLVLEIVPVLVASDGSLTAQQKTDLDALVVAGEKVVSDF
jgi:hypothetical protein